MNIQALRTAAFKAAGMSLSQSLGRRRLISTVSPRLSKAYDYDGKTKVSIFNTETDMGLMITGYSQYGFRLNNNMVLIGPITVFPRILNILGQYCHGT
nr:uncharacterized protein LOC6625015 isoform X2 [Drosophila virilis]XP_032292841.1 uncharacterized protein LOC116651110 isoform X2 [Drosophila virilis]